MLNIGFIGCGGIAEDHLKLLQGNDEVTITSFYDIDNNQAKIVAEKFKGKCFESLESFIQESGIDAVWVCVPPFAHGSIEERLIKAQIPFFVEKPVANKLEVAKRIEALLQKTSIATSVGYHWRYKESVKIAKEYLEGKNIQFIQGTWGCSLPPVEWWLDSEKSGGQLVEQATHIFDLIRYLGGEFSQIHSLAKFDQVYNIPRNCSVNFTLKNGTIGNIAMSNLFDEDSTPFVKFYTEDCLIIVRSRDIEIKFYDGTYKKFDGFDNGMKLEQESFLNAVKLSDHNHSLSKYSDSVKTLEATLAAKISYEIGEIVTLNN